MDFINSVWQLGVIALIAGVMIGILAYRLLTSSEKEADKLKSELDSAREELSEYKANVNQHFDKTSELVNELTQNYVNVYRHLADGAQTLGDGRTFNNLLENHKGKVSIAVDDPIESPASIEQAAAVDAVVTAAETAPPVDEHAEAFDQVTGAIPERDGEDSDAAEADASKSSEDSDGPAEADASKSSEDSEGPAEADASMSSGDSDDSAEVVEPVLNVEALDQAGEIEDAEVQKGIAKAAAEVEEKIEPGATRH